MGDRAEKGQGGRNPQRHTALLSARVVNHGEAMEFHHAAAVAVLIMAGFLGGCVAEKPPAASVTMTSQAHDKAAVQRTALVLDAGFSKAKTNKVDAHEVAGDVVVYSAVDIDGGRKCVVGIEADEDGMSQRPIVYVADGNLIAWKVSPEVPPEAFQGRATHCIASGGALFVLMQFDTQPEEALSQTFLQVTKLNSDDGRVLVAQRADVPATSAAYTAWVEKETENFSLAGDKIRIKARYALLSDREAISDFLVEIPKGIAKALTEPPSVASGDGSVSSIAVRAKLPVLRQSFDKCMDEAAGVTYDMMNCIEVEFEYQDARLNAAYKQLRHAVAQKEWGRVKLMQREWLKNMDDECRNDELGGGTAQMLDTKMCVLERTAKKVEELEAMLARVK